MRSESPFRRSVGVVGLAVIVGAVNPPELPSLLLLVEGKAVRRIIFFRERQSFNSKGSQFIQAS